MIDLVLIALSFFMLYRQLHRLEITAPPSLAPKRTDPRLAQLTTYADRLYSERRWLAAEKAYLSVLKLDHKNSTAYTHLGVIYSTQKNLADAIECFSIAARLRPSGGTLQNLALAFFENRNYIKSIATYEKAIMFEPTAQRYVGLGKAHLKLSNLAAAAQAYEQALEIDPSRRMLERLLDVYQQADRKDDAAVIQARLRELAAPPSKAGSRPSAT